MRNLTSKPILQPMLSALKPEDSGDNPTVSKSLPRWPKIIRRTAVALLGFTLSHAAQASSVTLAWDKNPEIDIAGYELSFGTTSGIYPNSVNAGNVTVTTVPDLQPGATYYFVVRARNQAGTLSPKSEEIAYNPSAGPSVKPPNGTIKTPAATVTLQAGKKVEFAGTATGSNKSALTYRWNFGETSGIPESTDLHPGKRVFNRPGTYQVSLTVTDSHGISDPTPAVQTIIVRSPAARQISRQGWKLKYTDSQETDGYAASNAFDGDPATFWHTQFIGVPLLPVPHEIQIDLGKSRKITGFQYQPRQDAINVGHIGEYRFYVSTDGVKWGKAVAKGTFESSTATKTVYFTPRRGRFIRLRSLKEANGYTDTNIAELKVLGAVGKKKKSSRPAPLASATPASSKNLTNAISSRPASAARLAGVESAVTAGAPPSISTVVIGGRNYRSLTVTKSLTPGAKAPVIEVSPDLTNWFSGENHTTVITDNEAILTVRDNTPVSRDRKRFIRLKSQSR